MIPHETIDNICATVNPPQKLETTEYQADGEFPIIDQSQSDVAGYTNNIASTLPPDNYILFGDHTCTLKFINKRFAQGADGLKILKCANGVDPKYIYYAMKSLNFKTERYKRHWSEFKQLSVPIPSLDTQHKIAGVLSALDDKIELNDKINRKLNELARLIYDYWFVQFDFPDEHGRPYRASGGKMVYNDLLKREIPEGWKAQMLSDLAHIVSGYPFKASTYTNDGYYKVITIKNVKTGYIDSTTTDSIGTLPGNIPDECILDIGDILISLTGNVGRVGRVYESNLLLNQRVGKITLKDVKYKSYTYLMISSPASQQHMEQLAGGSSQANLSPIQATKFHVVVPPSKILDSFNSIISPILALDINNRRESKQLAQLRDWLLPMLMNGQVVVN